MKYLLLSLFLAFFTLTSYSQNAKPGTVYCYNKNTGELVKINAELVAIMKARKVKGLQYQLKGFGYDVDVTGCIDKKTIKAFEANKKRLKKQKREKRRKVHLARRHG
jgi:N-acetyl-anhydromuramyl-L-alanine amidase AmpD